MMADNDKQVIVPRFKMIVAYDVRPSLQDEYYQFVLTEFVPALQDLGIYMTEAWHTAYGDYPMRMLSFVAEEYQILDDLLSSTDWVDLEEELQSFVRNYSMRVIKYHPGFQFINPN